MLVQLMVGLFVLKAVVASPRFARQVELDTYDSTNYDVDLENLNLENQDIYDYEDGLTIDNPQIEIGTLAPPDYNYPVPEASLEEEQEEEEEELPLKPQLIPQGSGGSGVLMGPNTQKEEELRLTPIDILHISGDFGGSVGSGASGVSGASGSGGSGDLLVLGGSGGSGDLLLGSGGSGDLLSSGGSGDLLASGDLLGSGDALGSASSGASGDLGSGGSGISGDLPLGSGVSVDLLGSGFSGDHLGSGASGISGVSGDLEDSIITLVPGGEELPLIPDTIPQEASGASGEFSGASGTSGASGDLGVSGASGDLGVSGASGVSGSGEEPGVTLLPDIDEEEELLPTTPRTPEEGTGGVEGSVDSGLPEPDKPDEPDEPDEPDRRDMPTCLLCTCLGSSVYCDDLKLDSVPPLPKDTTHFYARYNRITKINKSDFASMNKLKRIDLTANQITSIDDKAFLALPALEELVIRENHVSQLPALPETMTLIDASHNNIAYKGIHKEAFKDMTGLLYLYLTDNRIDYIPVPLPDSLRSLHLQRNNIQMMHEDTFCNLKDFNYIRNALEDIRLDGNPINLSRTPQAYVCLPRIPIGDLI
ncbi:leucine-rich repeat protein soc-2 homolog [Myripristis murdjan]|uniref:Epiphycan n=1 Tax=Myripristis murdjan TaxID=586833 RepID=A0A667Z170_9TELE|nr:leucine-rich repeat protein soc-2 homolog [Myripristis murdjan]